MLQLDAVLKKEKGKKKEYNSNHLNTVNHQCFAHVDIVQTVRDYKS